MDEVPDPLPKPARFERSTQGGTAIHYVPGEVLVDADDEQEARRALRAHEVTVETTEARDARLGIVRLGVNDGVSGRRLHKVVADIHDKWSAPVQLQLVYWMHPSPHIHVWPGCLPVGEPVAPPPPGGSAGRGVRVAVLDTGVADHSWFGATRDPASQGEIAPELVVDGRKMLSPLYGHGTFVAGVVHARAPGATVVGRRLPLDVGMCRADRVAEAVLALVDDRPDVVNLSWGCYTLRATGTLVVERAVKFLLQALPGAVVVAAAGNDGIAVPTYPAAQKEVVAVGAVDADGRRADVTVDGAPHPFDHWASNFGWWVDTSAPGVDVVGPYPAVPSRPLPTFDGRTSEQFDSGFARWGGTSFAAPAVAGEIAARAVAAGSAAKAARELLSRPGDRAIDLRETPV